MNFIVGVEPFWGRILLMDLDSGKEEEIQTNLGKSGFLDNFYFISKGFKTKIIQMYEIRIETIL